MNIKKILKLRSKEYFKLYVTYNSLGKEKTAFKYLCLSNEMDDLLEVIKNGYDT